MPAQALQHGAAQGLEFRVARSEAARHLGGVSLLTKIAKARTMAVITALLPPRDPGRRGVVMRFPTRQR